MVQDIWNSEPWYGPSTPGECYPYAYQWSRMGETWEYLYRMGQLQDAAACGDPLYTLILLRIERASEAMEEHMKGLMNRTLYGDGDRGPYRDTGLSRLLGSIEND